MGLGAGTYNSTLRFEDETDFDVSMNTVWLSGSRYINEKWIIRAGVAVITDGELNNDSNINYNVQPGGSATLGLDYSAITGRGYSPYVDLSLAFSISFTETENPADSKKTNYAATDVRLGIQANWEVKEHFFPYLTARVFGGPVLWELDDEDVTGADIHHYQLAIGTAMQFNRMGIYIEWSGAGEKTLNAGLSMAW